MTTISNLATINQEIQESAIFAGGCFWCTEAVFLELSGVLTVTPGYIGGETSNPTYSEICKGTTGHAEAIKISFDSKIITFEELLEVFFATHDPTTLNRQGNDIGTQYRSEVFYTNENQKIITLNYIDLLNNKLTFGNPIVTKVSEASTFFNAEAYHQNYYNQNNSQGYCSYIITPKIEKLRNKFQSKLKNKHEHTNR
ncbi:peptide-methionine (S)-S-oxide reductase MsrA [Flavobacterium luteum]|uniref:Peptide methionine sulfoxide reductase MsrA n=1 Tax=Flavobacterium luteum TaxID=2026654 RepID=A0A7J5A9K6_9FLAO|nr:peptide-methionine (S)-S-oxide reductase MsrA [Flavobacterium luteum]KAB1154118.1 peptide-methionine (S)-S-oxide reductase MsrA [Flavobacterium luteum]